MTNTMAPEERNNTEEQTVVERAAKVAAEVGAQVQAVAAEATTMVADRAPAALAASRDTAEHIVADLRGRGDGSLLLGTVFAAGLSGGMLVSRAPRLLVAVAFLTTLAFGGTLLGRRTAGIEEPLRKARP